MKNEVSNKIAVVFGFPGGNIIYLEYLREAVRAIGTARPIVAFNIPSVTAITSTRASEILGVPVIDTSYLELAKMKPDEFGTLICTENSTASYIDNDIRTICIGHGSSALPTKSEFFFGENYSYLDVVAMSARSLIQVTADGISRYRKQRRNLAFGVSGVMLRSDIRSTRLMPVFPMKLSKIFSAPQFSISRGGLTVGLLPTFTDVIQADATLYRNIVAIIEMLLSDFPGCHVIVRPYPHDMNKPEIRQFCDAISNNSRISVLSEEISPSYVYDTCDVIITDCSTGGISHMLRKTIPPIYFIPEAALSNVVNQTFVKSLQGKIPIAHDLAELRNSLNYILGATPEQLYRVYAEFCQSELFTGRTQEEYFYSIINNKAADLESVTVNSFGEIIYNI